MPRSYVRHDDLRIYPGDDRALTWGPMLDDADDPLNLVGWWAAAQVRPMLGGDLLHEWSTDAGTIDLTQDGYLTLRVTDSEMWSWVGGRYDIHLRDPNTKTQVLVKGTVALDRGVTSRA